MIHRFVATYFRSLGVAAFALVLVIGAAILSTQPDHSLNDDTTGTASGSGLSRAVLNPVTGEFIVPIGEAAGDLLDGFVVEPPDEIDFTDAPVPDGGIHADVSGFLFNVMMASAVDADGNADTATVACVDPNSREKNDSAGHQNHGSTR